MEELLRAGRCGGRSIALVPDDGAALCPGPFPGQWGGAAGGVRAGDEEGDLGCSEDDPGECPRLDAVATPSAVADLAPVLVCPTVAGGDADELAPPTPPGATGNGSACDVGLFGLRFGSPGDRGGAVRAACDEAASACRTVSLFVAGFLIRFGTQMVCLISSLRLTRIRNRGEDRNARYFLTKLHVWVQTILLCDCIVRG